MARSVLSKVLTLAAGVAFNGDTPPSEIRLFKAGINETTKGEFLFDAKAAEMVMAAAKAWGVDFMIDLEHLSLDSEARHYNPDALGHFALDVRNGELWAVNVRWNAEGVRRLSEKTQRYISPAFMTDDDNRITEVVNIALVAMPATHGTPALVAANRSKPRMSLKAIATLTAALSIGLSQVKLAQDAAAAAGDPAPGKFATVTAKAEALQTAITDLQKAEGSDPDTLFSAMQAAVKAAGEFEAAVAAATGAAPEAEPAGEAMSQAEQQQMARERAELIALKKEKADRERDAEVQRLAAEMTERTEIEAWLVKNHRETPASVKLLSGLSLADLRTRKQMFEGSPSPTVLGKIEAPRMVANGGAPASLLSEDEVTYVKARHTELSSAGMKLRSVDDTVGRLLRLKTKQLAGATENGDERVMQSLSSKMDRRVLALGHRSGLITLASTPVMPFDEMGASSQIALQTFGLEYNLALASAPSPWAEAVGRRLPDGSLKTTYPINFRQLRFQEKTAQNAAAGQPMNADVEVKKREFYEGQEIELKRLRQGDFAYVQSWGQLAGDLARARLALPNELVTALIEAATSGYWGLTAAQTTGIDGQPFWSASHMVNPFDATMALRTSTTWSNYQSSAKPLNSTNLTAQKSLAKQVAAPDGREVNIKFDGILVPSSLEETAVNLLTVQQVIMDAAASLNSVSNVFAGVTNPHYNSGLQITTGQELAGTDTTANYYLYSREGIARGLFPWVISEDPTEELRQWDENSDHYKNTGRIKWESHVWTNAVLLFPHAIRYIKGA